MDCFECDSLWAAYQTVMINCVRIDHELRATVASSSVEDFRALSLESETVERVRTECRRRIAVHQAETGHI